MNLTAHISVDVPEHIDANSLDSIIREAIEKALKENDVAIHHLFVRDPLVSYRIVCKNTWRISTKEGEDE